MTRSSRIILYSKVLHLNILYYTIPYYILLHYTIHYNMLVEDHPPHHHTVHINLFYIINTKPHNAMPCHSYVVLYYDVPHHTLLHYTIL